MDTDRDGYMQISDASRELQECSNTFPNLVEMFDEVSCNNPLLNRGLVDVVSLIGYLWEEVAFVDTVDIYCELLSGQGIHLTVKALNVDSGGWKSLLGDDIDSINHFHASEVYQRKAFVRRKYHSDWISLMTVLGLNPIDCMNTSRTCPPRFGDALRIVKRAKSESVSEKSLKFTAANSTIFKTKNTTSEKFFAKEKTSINDSFNFEEMEIIKFSILEANRKSMKTLRIFSEKNAIGGSRCYQNTISQEVDFPFSYSLALKDSFERSKSDNNWKNANCHRRNKLFVDMEFSGSVRNLRGPFQDFKPFVFRNVPEDVHSTDFHSQVKPHYEMDFFSNPPESSQKCKEKSVYRNLPRFFQSLPISEFPEKFKDFVSGKIICDEDSRQSFSVSPSIMVMDRNQDGLLLHTRGLTACQLDKKFPLAPATIMKS